MRNLGWIAAGAVVVAALAFLIIDSVGGGAKTGRDSAPPTTVVTAPTVTRPRPTGSSALDTLRASVPLPDVKVNPPAPADPGASFALATVRPGEKVALHASPGGKVLKVVGDRTEFNSIRVFWVEQVRGDWFGVPSADLPNGRLAWIRDDRFALNLSQTRFWITAHLSRRLLELHYADKVLERMRVTVG